MIFNPQARPSPTPVTTRSGGGKYYPLGYRFPRNTGKSYFSGLQYSSAQFRKYFAYPMHWFHKTGN